MLSKKKILESHACIRIVFFEMVNKKKVKEKITVDHLFEDNIKTNVGSQIRENEKYKG